MSTKKYYLMQNDKILGPFDLKELREKNISPESLVWKAGLQNWTKAQAIDELSIIFITPPPFEKDSQVTIENSASIKDKSTKLLQDESKILNSLHEKVSILHDNQIKSNQKLQILIYLTIVLLFMIFITWLVIWSK